MKYCKILAVLILIALLSAVAMAAPVEKSGNFFFIQLADTQLGMANNNGDLTPEVENFKKAVEHINRLKPAFVIISGDLVNKAHDIKETRAFWSVAGQIDTKIPLYLVPGNHDIGQASAQSIASYQKLFSKDHYAFSCNGSEFIILDSNLYHDADSDQKLKDTQRKWFEDSLANAQKKSPSHIFVCTHHPWFINSSDEPDKYENIPQTERKDYMDMMKRNGVDFALAGHFHQEASSKDGGLTLIITSSVGKALGKDPVGFRIVKVYKDQVEQAYYTLDKMPEKVMLNAQ